MIQARYILHELLEYPKMIENEGRTAPFQHRTNTMRLHIVLSVAEMWWHFNFAAGNLRKFQ